MRKKGSKNAGLDAFTTQVLEALRHLSDPRWLGEKSPLAAPYFLGLAAPGGLQAESASARGQTLRKLLIETAQHLQNSEEQELYNLLKAVYFVRRPRHTKSGIAPEINLSERTLYRKQPIAVKRLADLLTQTLSPSLRPEIPFQRLMVGRAALLNDIYTELQAGQTVYLYGPSGMGKTMLGAKLTQLWSQNESQSNVVFWYTFRGQLNDSVASFLFALAYFLHRLGASSTWKQLVADPNTKDISKLMALVRSDLESIPKPLLAIDEPDILQDEITEQKQLLHILEELQNLCPCLFISQRVITSADVIKKLDGLTPDELTSLLHYLKITQLSANQRQKLLEHTRGNPALITLFAGLLRDGDDPDVALLALARTPSAEGLFSRIWRRLTNAERTLLLELSVYRSPSPLEVWKDWEVEFERLQKRELIQLNGQGGVQVLPHIQKFAYERVAPKLKSQLHLKAAEVREARSEYIAVLFHKVAAGEGRWALLHWLRHSQNEINRGQSSTALEILSRIQPEQLSNKDEQAALHIARATLREIVGAPEEALEELEHSPLPESRSLHAHRLRLEASLLEFLNRRDQALKKYQQAIEVFAGAPRYNEVLTHNRLTFLNMYQFQNPQEAQRHAFLARAKADDFLADMESMAGNYPEALQLFQSAESYAELANSDLYVLSRIYSHWGTALVKLRKFDEAIRFIDKAIDCDRKRGERAGPLYDLMNRATANARAGRYAEGLQDALTGLKLAEDFKNSYLISGLAACVAEVHMEAGQLQEAEYYLNYSLQQEEEFFFAPNYLMLGQIYFKRGNPQKALEAFELALKSAQQLEDHYVETEIWCHKAIAYLRLSKNADARKALKKTLELNPNYALPNELEKLKPHKN